MHAERPDPARERAEAAQREAVDREEQQRRQRIHNARLERAVAQSAQSGNWRRARELREFAAELRGRLDTLPDKDRVRITDWCDWIENTAGDLDPIEHVRTLITFNDERDQYWHPSSPQPKVAMSDSLTR